MQTWTGQGKKWETQQSKKRERPERDPSRNHWSASQISTYRDCKRKWAFGYIDKIGAPPNAYAKLGSYIHKQLEGYLKTGRLPRGQEVAITVTKKNGVEVEYSHDEIAQIMLPGVSHLPAPGIAKCEGYFELFLGDDLGVLVGYKDFVFVEDGVLVVGDHKTTSGLGWALTEEKLKDDVQATIYAVEALERDPSATAVKCRWVYYVRDPKKPKAKKVETIFYLTETIKKWDNILETIKEMKALKDTVSGAKKVEPTVTACSKYGGCPYKDAICSLTSADRIRSISTMATLKERMAARKAQPKAPAPVPAEGAGQAINPPEGQSALARLRARKAQPEAPAQVEAKAQAPAQVEAKAPAQVEAKAQAPAQVEAKAFEGFTLYVDCAPFERGCVDLHKILAPVLSKIKGETGYHYKLVPDMYGANGALLAEEFEEYLQTNPLPPHVMMSLSTQEERDVYGVLKKYASMVVRGF